MLLTVDIGTSVFKSAIWDFDGKQVAFHSVPLSITPGDGTRHEVDSGLWLGAFETCCRVLGRAAAVEAVVVSGNGPTLVPVSADGSPAAPARLWLDRRATEAARRVSDIAGGFVDAGFFLPKALDIKTCEPALYEKTRFFLGCPELLAFALTGEPRTVFPSDGFERWFWTDSVLARLDLDREKFPPFIRPGEVFGGLVPRAASGLGLRLGLRPGIPVIAGGPDFIPAILGSGVVRPGQACNRTGTSDGVNACTESPAGDPRLMSYGHPVKPFRNLSGIISTTGKAVEWGLNLLGMESYDDFFSLARTARAGAGGMVFLPYLAGERAPVWDPAARGILRGLGLSSGRADFARSVLEGICLATRDIIGIIEETGAAVDELRVAGSAAGNDLMNRIRADVTGKRVLVPAWKETELLGLAVIGSCAMGRHSSFSEAAGAFVRVEREFLPDGENAALYDGLFAEYRGMRDAEREVREGLRRV